MTVPPPSVSRQRRFTDDGYSFDSEAFQRYGGSSAWFENLMTTGRSRVLERVAEHLAATFFVAAVVALCYGAAEQGLFTPEVATAVKATALPLLPHEVIGSFIGVLLAFRTSQAYDRFWEARTLWDGVYSRCRSIVRLTSAIRQEDWRSSSGDERSSTATTTQMIVGLTAAFPYALKQHLRGVLNLQELVAAATAASECARQSQTTRQLAAAACQPNVPLAILDRLSRALLSLRKKHGDLLWWQLDASCDHLIDILSKTERIKGTPVPLSYSRHTSRFFSVYAFTLPFALAPHINLWLLPPTVSVISWVLFATEEIGHIIEEPFGRGLADDFDSCRLSDTPYGTLWDPQVSRVFAAGDDVTDVDVPVLEVLPLGRYCADIASDAATLFLAEPVEREEMPGGDDELRLFDELS